MAEVKSISGSCSCGNISWISSAEPQHLDFCYCLTCQKVSGAPFMAWTGIPRASIEWKYSGPGPIIYRSRVGDTDISVGERVCCRSCGCNVSLQYYLYPEKTHVAASTVDNNGFEPMKVGCHIWIKHVPSWYSIPDDGIERYKEFDDDFHSKLDKYLIDRVEERQSVSTGGKLTERNVNNMKGEWWAGLMPANAADYTAINGPDSTTMAELWEDPTKVRKPY